ncbi:MAG TPA: FAD-dependent oxidoreductase [Arsenicitalea sp.]|jgi:glycine oxidase|nr:FAD-dependent oxidoreductase [Arsenicitalea sp.]
MRVRIIGAGVAGLTCALELAERGVSVEVIDRGRGLGDGSCSWSAGGMLAPWCELATAEPLVATLGERSIAWWLRHYPETVSKGTLVVAPARDTPEISRFGQRTTRFEWIDAEGIAAIEPDLAGRFQKALFFPDEAHLDPRRALAALSDALRQRGIAVQYGVDASASEPAADFDIDCRGFAARGALPDLRGVKGEMIVLRSRDLALARPVRMLHPRFPLYVVPRGNGVFMIGATMIESEERGRVSVRSMLELLNGAYALHPAFGEAEIVEFRSDLRPAFSDNLPRIRRLGRTIYVNGLFRHGFLLAPALAQIAADAVLNPTPIPEAEDANLLERHDA